MSPDFSCELLDTASDSQQSEPNSRPTADPRADDPPAPRFPIDLTSDEIPLGQNGFLLDLMRHLSGTLEEIVGLKEASGLISLVGRRVGEEINRDYCQALNVESLAPNQIGPVLIDLKRRIKGDFYIIEESDDKIVFGNRACPFGERVRGRPSLCMMTSNVFGYIAAENNGFAKVSLHETIAQGAANCRVVVYLQPSDEAQAASGREYYQI